MMDWRKTIWAYFKPEKLVEIVRMLRELGFSQETIQDVVDRIPDVERAEIHILCRVVATAGFQQSCVGFSTKRWTELVTGRAKIVGKYSQVHYCGRRRSREILYEYELAPGTIMIERIDNKYRDVSEPIRIAIVFACPKWGSSSSSPQEG